MGARSRRKGAEPLVFRFPMPPSRSQDNRSWKARHYGKKRWMRDANPYVLFHWGDDNDHRDLDVPKWGRADYTAELYVWNRYDDDGAVAQLKWPLDWLEKHDYVGNDRYMTMLEPPVQHISRGKDRRSEVVLTVWPGGREESEAA